MRTRIEILKNETWIELTLKKESIRYNVLCNKIGELENRRISHSNTLSLPYVSENIIALDINAFSPVLMAEALNKKFKARYYVKDKLLQEGYLVINNTVRGDINVNFIDEALAITDQWGKTTFKQLLLQLVNDPLAFTKSVINSNYMNNLVALSEYSTDRNSMIMTTSAVVCDSGDDSSIQQKVAFIAKYPNSLNNIGDKFQKDKDQIRKKDFFNPLQSRPIFSMFSFLYLVTQAYGYKLKLDLSVSFELLRDSYMTSKGVSTSTPIDEVTIASNPTTRDYQAPQFWTHFSLFPSSAFYEHFFVYEDTPVTFNSYGMKTGIASKTPNEVQNYVPSTSYFNIRENLFIQKCIVQIEPTPYIGDVIWTGEITSPTPESRFSFENFITLSVWKTATGQTIEAPFITEFFTELTPKKTFKVVGNKSQLNNTPPEAVTFVGLVLRVVVKHTGVWALAIPNLANMKFIEKTLPKGVTQLDSFGQYIYDTTNLLEFSPDTAIKDLLSNCLQQQGILLSFEKDEKGIQNIAKLFTYGAYRQRVKEAQSGLQGKYYDWSEYHLKNISSLFNTDYGAKYGELNEVSLSDPFPGNISNIKISTNIVNKGFQSKLPPLMSNKTSSFKDISSVTVIGDTDTYFEYENKGQGLVRAELGELLPGNKTQCHAEQTNDFVAGGPIFAVSNIIYPPIVSIEDIETAVETEDFLPPGIKEWYHLVDVAVRSQATFLLPLLVIKTFDISFPIYVESLGGFYIVEQIGEYIDNTTPVKVDLIKLPL